MDPETAALLAYVGIEIIREIRAWREDIRAVNSLPPPEPLSDDIETVAADYARKHGLPLPGGSE